MFYLDDGLTAGSSGRCRGFFFTRLTAGLAAISGFPSPFHDRPDLRPLGLHRAPLELHGKIQVARATHCCAHGTPRPNPCFKPSVGFLALEGPSASSAPVQGGPGFLYSCQSPECRTGCGSDLCSPLSRLVGSQLSDWDCRLASLGIDSGVSAPDRLSRMSQWPDLQASMRVTTWHHASGADSMKTVSTEIVCHPAPP